MLTNEPQEQLLESLGLTNSNFLCDLVYVT